ncbi:hypothetical protein [Desulfobacterium sp. N47]|uniref:Uncharacterized protein n=1 Tax=uncultured Desulfobacterium sp. TaxID=201089 RepID=E1YDT1_9BACT|nr:unknown protein [uncultured Desulfobacterium sp.]
MIKSFRDNWLQDFFADDIQSEKIPAVTRSRLFRKLQLHNDVTNDVIAHHGVLDEGVLFIRKPFSIKDLASKLRDALDGEAGVPCWFVTAPCV